MASNLDVERVGQTVSNLVIVPVSSGSGVSLYVQVRRLRESLDRAVDLGAAIVLEPFDLPGGPTMAGITDPEGNPVMLVQQ